ncbi:MAG: fimbrillin family protein, partial [Bacteroidaceae bacterium]|nr:fimbrillin family protein [Bacteroidaceae bacterium]
MKKEIIQIIAVAVGLFSVMGCSKESGMGDDCFSDITIQASIGKMTKVSYDGNGSSFTPGDTILLYGWTGSNTSVPAKRVVDARKNGFDGRSWIPSNPMFWKNSTEAHYFIGIYPVPDSVTSFTEAAYTVDPDDYESNDLLIATNLAGVKATDGPVNLNFDHVM